MKMCQTHWDRIRVLVEERGLSHLIGTAEQAMQAIADEVDGQESTHFDPLMAVNNLIMGQALQMGGLYLMSGDFCPVCEAMKHTAHLPRQGETEPVGEAWVEDHWTVGPVDAVHEVCRQKGLVPSQ